MIEERDLDAAVTAGVIDAATRERLVTFTRDHRRGAAGPDEEQFRLLTGFNDIFVTIAVGLVLFALGALAARLHGRSARRWWRWRRGASPNISPVSGGWRYPASRCCWPSSAGCSGRLCRCPMHPAQTRGPNRPAGSSVARRRRRLRRSFTGGGSWCRSPSRAGAAALGGVVVALVGGVAGAPADTVLGLVLVLGLITFALAMSFDARDRARVTRWTDVAFWLHLLAAPAIIHPVFALSGLLGSSAGPGAAIAAVLVYAVLTVVALAIDRRALLVSALGYVIYAIQALLTAGGSVNLSTALTALVIGSFLVMLSAAWRTIRARVLRLLPPHLAGRLPVAAV